MKVLQSQRRMAMTSPRIPGRTSQTRVRRREPIMAIIRQRCRRTRCQKERAHCRHSISIEQGRYGQEPRPEAGVVGGGHFRKSLRAVVLFARSLWQTIPGALFVLGSYAKMPCVDSGQTCRWRFNHQRYVWPVIHIDVSFRKSISQNSAMIAAIVRWQFTVVFEAIRGSSLDTFARLCTTQADAFSRIRQAPMHIRICLKLSAVFHL